MTLSSQSSSEYNTMLSTKISHPPSTTFNDDFPTRPAKRVRITRTEIPDSDDEEIFEPAATTTQLETTLPPVQNEAEAIEAYEAHQTDTVQSRLENRSWTQGRSSIYVDAFNLALDTVLEVEKHLFDEAELRLFEEWRAMGYESQYLYVRLFLRKTSKWFRVKDLPYYSDISDVEGTVENLQLERHLPTIKEEVQQHPGELEPPDVSLGVSFAFAQCSADHISTLDEASSLLLLEELKEIAKQVKVQGKNKKELLQNLRRTSGRQAGLGFKRTDTEERSEMDGSITPDKNRDTHFTKKILNQTGRCIRLSLKPLKLFERVHLVFYRSVEWTEKSLTTLILAKISRKNFPEYIVSRSATIFESRPILLEFEAGLRTQFRVDSILEFNGPPGLKGLEEVAKIFEAVYPRWKALLVEEQRKEDRVYESGEGAYLRRFSPAWVYTRIIHKGLYPLARFKDHKREHGILSELLDQRLFHVAKRGAWYQRKALLEEHYMHALMPSDRTVEAAKRYWKRVALKTCEEGLEDRECHVIYHYDLQKRIRKIEKRLRLPLREQHNFGHVRLSKASERDVYGIKIEAPLSRQNSAEDVRRSTKTIWRDELDTALLVSVESMCLSYYRRVLDWKGYHSEGGILRTLFGLLFADILFAYVPNVFQTAYQTCPLDLHTDAFYGTRISEINARVNEIGDGEAERLIRRTWKEHFERRTCIVGVRWDEYELDDLLEIARSFPSEALGTVLRVMAQEYAVRGGGVPDLFLWNGEDVMFVEVKSENDRLSDTQRLWISVLLGAGVRVELCHALAKEIRED